MDLGEEIARHLEDAVRRWQLERRLLATQFADAAQTWLAAAWPEMPDGDWRPGFESLLAEWQTQGVKVTADSKQKFADWLDACARTMREPHKATAIGREVSDSSSEKDRERRLANGDQSRAGVAEPKALTDEDLIPKSYYFENDQIHRIVDAEKRRQGMLAVVGMRDRVTGKIYFDPRSKARFLLMAIKEQRQTLASLSMELMRATESVRDTGDLDEGIVYGLSDQVRAAGQRYEKLVLAFTANQRELSATDPYAGIGLGVLPNREDLDPELLGQLRKELKANERKWAQDAEDYGRLFDRLKTTQTTLDYASWALVGTGLAVQAAKIGGTAGIKFLATQVLKTAGAVAATTLAAKGAQAAGVSNDVIEVGTRIAVLWIQIRAARNAQTQGAPKETASDTARPKPSTQTPPVDEPTNPVGSDGPIVERGGKAYLEPPHDTLEPPETDDSGLRDILHEAPTDTAGPKPRAPDAPTADWVRPKGWRLPTNGTWEGTPGNSNFKPTNPMEHGLGPEEVVRFHNGRADFGKWSKGNFTSKEELTGDPDVDLPRMYRAIAEAKNAAEPGAEWTQTSIRDWLSRERLSPHHAGGNDIQLIPWALHGNPSATPPIQGIRHMGGAYDLRNE